MAPRPSIKWTTITIDGADPAAMGQFYTTVFGWEITARDDKGWLQLRDPHGGVGVNIQAEDGFEPPVWPERAGRQQKMMHLEVLVDDLAAAVDLVVAAGGAEAAHQPDDRDPNRLRVMVDPAGHPFCLFVDGE